MEMTEYGEFTIKPSRFGAGVVGKLATMRKPQEFSVHPYGREDLIHVQSDKSCGVFDFKTGLGLLNMKGSYFAHLSPTMGAKTFQFPADFVAACLAACPALDSETTVGGVTIINTITVI
jgi:hypothetical protein